MRYKTCSKCEETKVIALFHKAANHSDGFRNDCKSCVSKYQKEHNSILYRKHVLKINSIKKQNREKNELLAFIRRMYNYMQCRVRGQVIIDRKYKNYVNKEICTRNDFIMFAMKNWNLKYLFCEWIKSGYQRKMVPTVDRIDNSKGYLINNIQFKSFRENVLKRWEDGIHTKRKTI